MSQYLGRTRNKSQQRKVANDLADIGNLLKEEYELKSKELSSNSDTMGNLIEILKEKKDGNK